MDKDRYTLKEVDEEICKRLQDDVYDEYLVDGAVLSCYQEAKGKLSYGEYMKDFEGHMVIDRQYYEDSGGYLKFNGPKGEK